MMATDTVRTAAVQATECALALLDGLRLTLEVTERFTERVDLAQAAMGLAERLPAVAGVRNRKAAGDGVRRNHTVAARECSGWKNCFESAERNLAESAQAFDAEIGHMPPRARQQVESRLAKAQPTAVSFHGFDPTYWEAETVRSLAGHTLGAMNSRCRLRRS